MAATKRAEIDTADASSATQVVAAVSGKKIRVYKWSLAAKNQADIASGITVELQDDAMTPVTIGAIQTLTAGDPPIRIEAKKPHFIGETTASQDLDIITGSAFDIVGWVEYSEES